MCRMQFTYKEIVDFCYANRRQKGFCKFEWDEIARHIFWATDNNCLFTIYDNHGLCGVCTVTIQKEAKRLYIHHIVAVRKGFATFIKTAFERYPGWTIQGLRSSKLVTFTERNLRYGRQPEVHK